MERGEFRADLFYRLNVVHLHIPPLRERPDDIPALLPLRGQAAQRLGHPVSVTPSALAALSHHGWPGNVRELRNAVERAAVLGGTGPLEPRDFAMPGSNGNGAGSPAALDLKSQVEAVERQAILRALEASVGTGARRRAFGMASRRTFLQDAAAPGPHGGVAQPLALAASPCTGAVFESYALTPSLSIARPRGMIAAL